jgi:hypothetical protein
MGDTQSKELLTYSVIDLSKIQPVTDYFDEFFRCVGKAYKEDPTLFIQLNALLMKAEPYGLMNERMLDIGSVFLNAHEDVLDPDIRNGMLDALSDAVIYLVRGSGRTRSNGLSFCCALAYPAEEKSVYARNCKSNPYLAYLDIFAGWDAPEEIYETEEKLEALNLDSIYLLRYFVEEGEDGLPYIRVEQEDRDMFAWSPFYELYQKDSQTGLYKKLGRDACLVLEGEPEYGTDTYFKVNDLTSWPSLNGELIDAEVLELAQGGIYLYDIPVFLSSKLAYLRMGRESTEETEQDSLFYSGTDHPQKENDKYYVYGLWDGYDEDTGMPGRNVNSLVQIAGQEFQTAYPLHQEDSQKKKEYLYGSSQTMYRSMEVEQIPLPAGTYLLAFTLRDIFGRLFPYPAIELEWDGSRFTILDDTYVVKADE